MNMAAHGAALQNPLQKVYGEIYADLARDLGLNEDETAEMLGFGIAGEFAVSSAQGIQNPAQQVFGEIYVDLVNDLGLNDAEAQALLGLDIAGEIAVSTAHINAQDPYFYLPLSQEIDYEMQELAKEGSFSTVFGE